MLLSSLVVVADTGEFRVFSLDEPEGYIIKSIDGLGPVKASLVSSPLTNREGRRYDGGKLDARNIVISMRLDLDLPATTANALRAELYRVFVPKRGVQLNFLHKKIYDGSTILKFIDGVVESVEANVFSKEPEMAISIMCYDPVFRNSASTSANGSTASSLPTALNIDYLGSMDTGFLFRLFTDRTIDAGSVLELSVDNGATGPQIMKLDIPFQVLNNQDIWIQTEPGSRSATLYTSPTENILSWVQANSDWPRLFPGNNAVRVTLNGAAIPYQVTYTVKDAGL